MFLVQEMVDVVKVPPSLFNSNGIEVLSILIEKKLCNKIIKGVGLCISMYQIDKIHPSKNIHGKGDAFTKVEFRFIVFKPFVSEIMLGTIKYCNQSLIKIDTEFFDEIVVYRDELLKPSEYLERESIYRWNFDFGGSKTENKGFFISPAQKVRVRVKAVHFDHDIIVAETKVKEEEDQDMDVDNEDDEKNENLNKRIEYQRKRKTMVVIGTFNEMGLGPVDWWGADSSSSPSEENSVASLK